MTAAHESSLSWVLYCPVNFRVTASPLTPCVQLTSGQEVEIRLALRHEDNELLERMSDKAIVSADSGAACCDLVP